MASVHEKLTRVRRPRVHITYEVETEGAMVERELPFVVGVLGDFSGDPTQPLRPLSERKFVLDRPRQLQRRDGADECRPEPEGR